VILYRMAYILYLVMYIIRYNIDRQNVTDKGEM